METIVVHSKYKHCDMLPQVVLYSVNYLLAVYSYNIYRVKQNKAENSEVLHV